jgi:flagellar motor switch protein FliN/FliY
MDEPTVLLSEPPRAGQQPNQGPASPPSQSASPNLGTILSIPVTVQVVLGSTTLPVSSLMKLGRGAVISLDQRVGDPVDIVVNGKVVARGEIVVVDETSQRFGVSVVEIVANANLEHAA